MPTVKKEKKITIKKTTTRVGNKPIGLSVPVFTVDGTKSGALSLPKEIFGQKVNKPLLSQAIYIYMNNLKAHFGNTKTRAEVRGSTRKIRVQKGTGGARHGGIRAPIFVGGGIALGPKFRKVVLNLPGKMRQKALVSALSSRLSEGEVLGFTGEEKATGKTKQIAKFLEKIGKKDVLVVSDRKNEKFIRSTRNLKGIKTIPAEQLNAFEVIAHKTLILTKEAVGKLEERIR